MSGFSNTIVGGIGNLIRDWIQSVPFTSGSQGWRISKNGNAEFNSVTIRGGVVVTSGSQMFVYSSNPPASGTLVFSISPTSGIDPYGNNYVAGFVNYDSAKIGIVNGTFTITSPTDQLELQWDTINYVLSLNNGTPLNFVVSSLMAHLGVDGFVINAGTVNGVTPGTGTTFANKATPETWHTLTLNAGWTNLAANIYPMKYRMLADGDVELSGTMNSTSATPNNPFATLPTGYFNTAKGHRLGATVRVLSTGNIGSNVVDIGIGGGLTLLTNANAVNTAVSINARFPVS